MRAETQVIDVPPRHLARTWLICEEKGCKFRTTRPELATAHMARSHAVRAEKTEAGVTLRWFDSQQNAQAWLDVCSAGEWGSHVSWSGPGWYVDDGHDDHDRLSIDLRPASSFANELAGEAAGIQDRADRILAASEQPPEGGQGAA